MNKVPELTSTAPQAAVAETEITGQPKPMLLVCNKHEDTMSFVDLDSLEEVQKISTGPNPHEIVLTPDNRFAYLSNYAPPGNTISVIDLTARKPVKQISTGEYGRIHGAAIAPGGMLAYFTAGQSGYVVEVDTARQEMTRVIQTGGEISHMVLVSPDGERLYTANIATEDVSVLNRASGDLIAMIPCGKGVEGMGFTPDGHHLWALNQEGGSISVIDVASNRVIDTFDCPGMPVRVVFTNDGALALVPGWVEDGVLVVIDVELRQELKRIPVGSKAIGIVLSPDGRRVFVGCEHTDGVHVIDIESLTVETVIHTGDGSDAMAIWYPPLPSGMNTGTL